MITRLAPSKVFVLWVRATSLGWLIGIPCIIVLALLGEAVGIGGAQVLVGAGMGTGVGFMQSRVIRKIIGKSASWIWSCIVGLGLPFLIMDLTRVARFDITYSLLACVVAGGLIVGACQTLILRSHTRRSVAWMMASATGWTLAAGTSAIADSLQRSHSIRGIWGLVSYLGIVAAGGLVLGLVTGGCLSWIFRRETGTGNALMNVNEVTPDTFQ